MPDLIVESQGLCFLCLSKVTNDLDPNHDPLSNKSTQIYSLHNLSRFLKLDMGIVFYESRDSIPNHLLSKVRRSKLKVELCQGCADLNLRLAALHHQLEKIEIEVISNLNMIHQRIVKAGETELIQKLESVCESTDSLAEKVKIADVIRKETMQKCSLKLSKERPRVKIRKMTTGELKLAEKRTKLRLKRKSDLEIARIKMETTIPDMDDDDPFDNFEGDGNANFEPTHFTAEEDEQVEAKLNIFTPMECGICHMEVPDLSSHNCHSAGRQRRRPFGRRSRRKSISTTTAPGGKKKYKCSLCKKIFSSKFNYDRHALSIHMGKTFPCRYCSRVFTQFGHRSLHMRTKCPKNKMVKVEVNR